MGMGTIQYRYGDDPETLNNKKELLQSFSGTVIYAPRYMCDCDHIHTCIIYKAV